jgi:hypothetical protein
MTTRLSILILAAAVAPALACAPRTSSRAASPPAAPTAPAPAPGVPGGAQKPGGAEPLGRAATSALAQAGAANFGDFHAGLEGASSQDCLGCHADTRPVIQAHTSHPIDLDYAAVAGKRSADFTPLPDVLARGIAVPGGKVVCLTCHALSSPWKYHLAMPTGATLRPAVRLGDPSSYEEDSTSPPQPGSEVSAKPLCRACHAF